jgi:site-specific DNA-methyltransferase (adenine-specific)
MSIELLNIDCMEYMKGLEDNAFELAIVDPPYGIGEGKSNESRNRVASNNYKSKEWDSKPPAVEYFKELQRVSKNQIIWGANHFMQNIAAGSPCWIVWDKMTGDSDFADCELAYTSFKTAVRKFQFRWSGMLQGDMKNKEFRIHPTQKPVKLYDWLLSNYAKEGDKILDTHLGSGSSAIAAHYGGFDFVGCELDEDYYKAACERFDLQTRQESLF